MCCAVCTVKELLKSFAFALQLTVTLNRIIDGKRKSEIVSTFKLFFFFKFRLSVFSKCNKIAAYFVDVMSIKLLSCGIVAARGQQLFCKRREYYTECKEISSSLQV